MRHLAEALSRAMAGFIIGTVVYFSSSFMFYQFAPRGFWYNYLAIEAQESYDSGEDITLVSKLERRRGVSFEWNDVLRCKDGSGQFVYYSNSVTSANSSSAVEGVVEAPWVYQGAAPDSGVCFIQSNIMIELPFGVEKTQIIESNHFTIGSP